MADWLKPKKKVVAIEWPQRPKSTSTADNLATLRKLHSNEQATNVGRPKAHKEERKSAPPVVEKDEKVREFQSWYPKKETKKLPWPSRAGPAGGDWAAVAAHQERVLGDLAALEKRLWAYMGKQQQQALGTLDDLEKKAIALGGKPPVVKGGKKGEKEKEKELAWSAGHYHYTDCPNDTQEKYKDNACQCKARAEKHTASLEVVAKRSKGRVRTKAPLSSSSSATSPSAEHKVAEEKLSTPWRELASRQRSVLSSVEALEAKAWMLLEQQREGQMKQVQALSKRHDALEASLGGAANSKGGGKGNAQKQQQKAKKDQAKKQKGGKQGKQKQKAAAATPTSASIKEGFTAFDNSRFDSNVVHHLILQGLPAIQQHFPAAAAAEPFQIVAWKRLDGGAEHQAVNYVVQVAYQGGATLQVQLNRPEVNLGTVTVVSGAFTPAGKSLAGASAHTVQPPSSSSSAKDVKKLQEQLAKNEGLKASFAVAPSDYYSWSLEQRRDLLKAESVNHLFKSVIMHNSKADHTNYDDPLFSKYYMILVQYTASTNNEKLIKAFRKLTQDKTGKAIAKKKINFRLVPEDVSAELSGFGHNAVSPLGMLSKIPIVLTHEALQLEYMWLGGGHVDLKMKVKVKDFVAHFKPLIIDFTNPRANA